MRDALFFNLISKIPITSMASNLKSTSNLPAGPGAAQGPGGQWANVVLPNRLPKVGQSVSNIILTMLELTTSVTYRSRRIVAKSISVHGIPSFQTFSMCSLPGHLGLSLTRPCPGSPRNGAAMPLPLLLQTIVWASTAPKRAHSSCHPVAHFHNWTLGSPALKLGRGEVWARPRRETTALPSRTPTSIGTPALSSNGDCFPHCLPRPPALVWRLLAGRVVLHPGSGMRKGSHERFFPTHPHQAPRELSSAIPAWWESGLR